VRKWCWRAYEGMMEVFQFFDNGTKWTRVNSGIGRR